MIRLVYLERVIKETLRLFPSGPFVARQVLERTEFSGKVLPAGATLAANIYGVHRDPKHWPDPSRFDPDRFAVSGHPLVNSGGISSSEPLQGDRCLIFTPGGKGSLRKGHRNSEIHWNSTDIL